MHPERGPLSKQTWIILAAVLCLVLLFVAVPAAYAQEESPDLQNPDSCARCHQDAYHIWENSTHSNATTDPDFLEAWSRAGEPKYCYECHATGYDPVEGTVAYGGVGCTGCHTPQNVEGQPHMTVDTTSQNCAECHSGAHAPDYDQWLTSDHATMNIECVDCHTSHDTSLVMDNPTELCISCHADDFEGSVHGQEGMACHDCHMAPGEQVVDQLSGRTNGAGHSFTIPASVCSDCHGMTHTLQSDGESTNPHVDGEAVEQMVTEMETKASNNLNVGLAGGGIGGLLVGLAIPTLVKRRNGK